MKLYELTDSFSELFDGFDAICTYEPQKNEYGEYIDEDGSVIADIDAYRAELKQAWFDTLSGIEEQFEVKAENIAAYIKGIEAEAECLKKEENTLKSRRQVMERQVTWLKDYLLSSMNAILLKKIDMPKAKLSIRSNAESVRITDEKGFVRMCVEKGLDDYLRYQDPAVDKIAVKKALQSGKSIDGAELFRSQSLIIK